MWNCCCDLAPSYSDRQEQHTINQFVIYTQIIKEYLTQTAFMIFCNEFQIPAVTYIQFYAYEKSELNFLSTEV